MKQSVVCIHRKPNTNPLYEGNYIYCDKHKTVIEVYKCGKGFCGSCEFEPAAAIPIGRCDDCPFVEVSRTPRAGYAHDYLCSKTNKTIINYVEYDSEIPPIPDWCPYRLKGETV